VYFGALLGFRGALGDWITKSLEIGGWVIIGTSLIKLFV
jgi:hypothetical protein